MQCFRSFHTAERAIEGVEALHILRKGQLKRVGGKDVVGQVRARREPLPDRCIRQERVRAFLPLK